MSPKGDAKGLYREPAEAPEGKVKIFKGAQTSVKHGPSDF